MKKYLLPKDGNFYKANLHLHTTLSDGKLTPEETKKVYMDRGYSILAYTDHEVLHLQNDLTDDKFLAINSLEIAVTEKGYFPYNYKKTYHINLYAKSNDNAVSISSTPEGVVFKNVPLNNGETAEFKCEKIYDVNHINDLIEKANTAGFLVSYNHPVWSQQNYSDYIDLKNLWAIEVYNTLSTVIAQEDTVRPYEDLLRKNNKLVPLATDDIHTYDDEFIKGFTMVKSPSLNYDDVMKALENGDLYSSTGPTINELYIEDGNVYVSTSDAVSIRLNTDNRYSKRLSHNGEIYNEAIFNINDFLLEAQNDADYKRSKAYFRIEVVDKNGDRAWTKPYFIEDL